MRIIFLPAFSSTTFSSLTCSTTATTTATITTTTTTTTTNTTTTTTTTTITAATTTKIHYISLFLCLYSHPLSSLCILMFMPKPIECHEHFVYVAAEVLGGSQNPHAVCVFKLFADSHDKHIFSLFVLIFGGFARNLRGEKEFSFVKRKGRKTKPGKLFGTTF